ncbi:helix-turn-helix domain-containing protein [Microbacterium sp. Root553]|uniref:helix-turn-helix domain-containing protein n=1 Tax=Microbacterium sp. Root553 TaxID=1736556 RepID=UPI0009E8E67D
MSSPRLSLTDYPAADPGPQGGQIQRIVKIWQVGRQIAVAAKLDNRRNPSSLSINRTSAKSGKCGGVYVEGSREKFALSLYLSLEISYMNYLLLACLASTPRTQQRHQDRQNISPRSVNATCAGAVSSTAFEAVRVARGLTQAALASSAGVSQTAISLVEAGRGTVSKTATNAIAAALDVSAAFLQLPAP